MSNIIFEWLITFRWSVFSFVNIIIHENANILKWFNGTGSNMLTNILEFNQLPYSIKNAKDVRLNFPNYSTIIFIISLYCFENHRRNDNFLFNIHAILQVVNFFIFRIYEIKSWRPTCGWSSFGTTTKWGGTQTSTAGSTCSTSHRTTSGGQTLSSTTSKLF